MPCKGCAVARRAPRDQCGAHPWGRGGAGATKGTSCARSAAAIGWRKLGCKRRGCAHLEEPWNPTRSLFQTPASRSLHKQAGCPGGAPLTTDSSRPLRIAALRACTCNQGSADAPNPKPEGAHTFTRVKLAQQLSLRRHPRPRCNYGAALQVSQQQGPLHQDAMLLIRPSMACTLRYEVAVMF